MSGTRRPAVVYGLSLVAAIGALILVATGMATPTEAAAEPFTPQRLSELRAQGTPVFVNFTAAWCITCQVNERVALSGDKVARAFARDKAVYLTADWTRRDATIAQVLAEHGRAGVPLYLVYGAGEADPKVLPQILTPSLVVDALDKAVRPAV